MNIAYVDGGRIPSTKKTTVGGTILINGNEIVRYSEVGGEGSNDDAEIQSVIRCMELAIEHDLHYLHIRTDAKVVADMLTPEYHVLGFMITRFEQNLRNKDLKKAICIRTGERFRGLQDMKAWLARNQTFLETRRSYPPKYRDKLLALTGKLDISVELIPRETNTIADDLCKKARKKYSRKIKTSGRTSIDVPPFIVPPVKLDLVA